MGGIRGRDASYLAAPRLNDQISQAPRVSDAMQLLCTLRTHCRQWPRNTRTKRALTLLGTDFHRLDRTSLRLAVAVGTRVASRPPHRTVRAAFPHTAPTSGIERRTACRARDGV